MDRLHTLQPLVTQETHDHAEKVWMLFQEARREGRTHVEFFTYNGRPLNQMVQNVLSDKGYIVTEIRPTSLLLGGVPAGNFSCQVRKFEIRA